jgi:hypothetical protein
VAGAVGEKVKASAADECWPQQENIIKDGGDQGEQDQKVF